MSTDWLRGTLPRRDERDSRNMPRAALHLVRVLGYDRPQVPGSRHDLDGVGEVQIGRGEHDVATRGQGTLALQVADPRMSGRHARLARGDGAWFVEDLGSRNGTMLDGKRVTRAEVGEGSLVELGGTAFLVCTQYTSGTSAPDVLAQQLVAALPGVYTFSSSFERELTNLARLAPIDQSIVLHGETGTGKEVVARAIHQASRRAGAFLAVNCGALPPNLVESELFGHKKGAFSGATEDRPGLIRATDGGTLLLDEIGDLPLSTQAALLRVLQEREVMPVGATRAMPVDLRVIAASHKNLESEVAAGRFREDLWARLAGYTAELPALRDRREDLGLLIATLLARRGATTLRFTPEAGLALVQYDWPRNVRELDQVLTSATALAADGVVEATYLPRALQAPAAPAAPAPHQPPSRDSLSPEDLARRDALRAALAKHHGNIAAAGRELGVARMQIHRWLERFAIDITEFRER